MAGTVIALMYDFDKTLCTRDMQEYSFIPALGMEPEQFWDECNALAEREKMDRVLAYMYMMIQKSREKHRPILRESFVERGRNIEYFPGVTEWFGRINEFGRKNGVMIEHYIISSGLREIIEGSDIHGAFKEIFACEFHYEENGVADWPKSVVNYTTKTQFLFRINKGVLDPSQDDEVNRYTPEDMRRVPFRNMLYIGDGLTDVPCMKLVKVNGGQSIAVYQPGGGARASELLRDGRVNYITPADYTESGALDTLVKNILLKMKADDTLVREQQRQADLYLH